MTKPTKLHERPAKTQISLGIRLWSEPSQCAQCVAEDSMFFHTDSEDWLDWANAQADLFSLGAQVILLVLLAEFMFSFVQCVYKSD